MLQAALVQMVVFARITPYLLYSLEDLLRISCLCFSLPECAGVWIGAHCKTHENMCLNTFACMASADIRIMDSQTLSATGDLGDSKWAGSNR